MFVAFNNEACLVRLDVALFVELRAADPLSVKGFEAFWTYRGFLDVVDVYGLKLSVFRYGPFVHLTRAHRHLVSLGDAYVDGSLTGAEGEVT